MKKINFLLTLFFFSIVFFSCESDSSTIEENNQNEIRLSKLDFDDLDLNLDFESIEDIVIEIDEESKKTENVNKLIKSISKLNKDIKFRSENDKDFFGCSYIVVVNKNKIIITNFEFNNTPFNYSSALNKADIGGPAPPDRRDCPEGSDLIDVCWSEDCVAEAISEAASDFGNGDTLTITLHHGGLGGVSICAD
jgi:hypothetical protein